MSGPHQRKSLKSLLQAAADKMSQSPEHIHAAQVLAEMQEDLHKKISGDTVHGQYPGSISADNAHDNYPDKISGVDIPYESPGQSSDKMTGVNDRGEYPLQETASSDRTENQATTPQDFITPPPSQGPAHSTRDSEKPAPDLPSSLSEPYSESAGNKPGHAPSPRVERSSESVPTGETIPAPESDLHRPFPQPASTQERQEGIHGIVFSKDKSTDRAHPRPLPVPPDVLKKYPGLISDDSNRGKSSVKASGVNDRRLYPVQISGEDIRTGSFHPDNGHIIYPHSGKTIQEPSNIFPTGLPEKRAAASEDTQADLQISGPGITTQTTAHTKAHPATVHRGKARKPVKEIMPQRSRITGERQKELYFWLVGQGGAVRTTLSMLTQLTGIDDRTLRRILTVWEKEGIVEKTSGQFGIEVRVLIDERPTPPKRARQASETVNLQDVCPTLCAAGFTERHLSRILSALATQGIETSLIWTGLRHAEWELVNGTMVDKSGEAVASPVDWVYKSLIKDGTYRVPRGYVSPAELQRRQAEEEIEREREAMARVERLRAEQEALELKKQVEELLSQVLAHPEEEPGRTIIEKIPSFLRAKGPSNALFLSSCRQQITWYLQELSGISRPVE